ncbi:hypothetical protein JVU11DRAFT_4802 [Chiua virens]|nr:hypothetical protein JVU11DRAFT_4802 [Chiua virens]
MDTTMFEVQYRLVPVAVSQPMTFVYQPLPANPPSQAVPQPLTSSSAPSASTGEPNALFSSLSTALTLPPGLVSQVNTAATSNPTLSNLLQLAASGRATPDQLKSLGLLIQSLAISPSTGSTATTSQQSTSGTDTSNTPSFPAASAAPQQYQYPAATKDFDIVIEFRESPSDRWVFPRGPATCKFVSTSGDAGPIGDLTVSTIVPFPSMAPPHDLSGSETSVPTEPIPKQVVEFHFKMVSSVIWERFSRWIGTEEKMEENRKILAEIEPPQQQFLAYRLPEGSQLTQIQNAALPSYTMKPIKPSTESGKPRRRSAPRKSTQDPLASPAPKRKRQTQPKTQVVPPKIACFACGQANVPLIMGGRYCRPCAEGGRIAQIPQVNKATASNELPADDSVQPAAKSVDLPSQASASQLDGVS